MTFDDRIQLGSAALDAGDADDAYEHFAKAVELDPARTEAWLGRARAAALRATGRRLTLDEVSSSVAHAIEHAPGPRAAEIRSASAALLRDSAVAQHDRSTQRLDDYVSARGEWRAYLERCAAVVRALERAHELDPKDPAPLEKIVEVCTVQIAGVVYNDVGDYQIVTQRRHGITRQYEAELRAKIAACAAELATLRPGYTPPEVKKAELDPKSTCFVVTAAMGDPNHPDVVAIRAWRDERLAPTSWGRRLVAAYEVVGPAAARVVRRSRILRAASSALLVKPLAALLRALR